MKIMIGVGRPLLMDGSAHKRMNETFFLRLKIYKICDISPFLCVDSVGMACYNETDPSVTSHGRGRIFFDKLPKERVLP